MNENTRFDVPIVPYHVGHGKRTPWHHQDLLRRLAALLPDGEFRSIAVMDLAREVTGSKLGSCGQTLLTALLRGRFIERTRLEAEASRKGRGRGARYWYRRADLFTDADIREARQLMRLEGPEVRL